MTEYVYLSKDSEDISSTEFIDCKFLTYSIIGLLWYYHQIGKKKVSIRVTDFVSTLCKHSY